MKTKVNIGHDIRLTGLEFNPIPSKSEKETVMFDAVNL
jgi:hypothetical protein